MPRRKKLDYNPTTAAMLDGAMGFNVRLELKGWHRDHWPKNAKILRELVEEIDFVTKNNSYRSVDVCTILQRKTKWANQALKNVLPAEVRERGAAQYRYVAGRTYMQNTIGHDEVDAREDLQESFHKPDRHSRYD